MDRIVGNQGLIHIFEQIFYQLDVETLEICCLVSKEWHQNLRHYCKVRQFQKTLETRFEVTVCDELYDNCYLFTNLIEFSPGWSSMSEQLERQISVEEFYELIRVLKGFQVNWYRKYKMLNGGFKCFDFGMYMNKFSRSFQSSPIHYAAENGDLEFLKLMAETTIDFNLKDILHRTPFLVACNAHQSQVVKFLHENSERLRINVRTKDNQNVTALHYAMNDTIEYAKFFLDLTREDPLSFSNTTGTRETPYHWACRAGNVEIVKLLIDNAIEYNIDLNDVNIQGQTALGIAVERTNVEVARLLLDHPDIKFAPSDQTILNDACDKSSLSEKDYQMIELILSRSKEIGLDINLKDPFGQTAYDRIRKYGSNRLFKLFKKYSR